MRPEKRIIADKVKEQKRKDALKSLQDYRKKLVSYHETDPIKIRNLVEEIQRVNTRLKKLRGLI